MVLWPEGALSLLFLLAFSTPLVLLLRLGKERKRQEKKAKEIRENEMRRLEKKYLNSSTEDPIPASRYREAVQEILSTLLGAARTIYRNAGDHQWEAEIASSSRVNAFALPNGKIVVTTGILEVLQITKSELAAIIGHEMGHILRGHHENRKARTQTAQVVGFIGGLATSRDFQQLRQTSQAIHGLGLLAAQAFSRQEEYEADQTSWDLLNHGSNDYNPLSLITILVKMAKLETSHNNNNNTDPKNYLLDICRSHPYMMNRIVVLDSNANPAEEASQEGDSFESFLRDSLRM